MSESGLKLFVGVLCFIVFVISLGLIVVGQRNIGPAGLGTMMVGLVGLVGLLWFYNRKYR